MDRGEIFKDEFRVHPGENGSFILSTRNGDIGRIGRQYGFTGIGDLLRFLQNEAEGFGEHPAKEGV